MPDSETPDPKNPEPELNLTMRLPVGERVSPLAPRGLCFPGQMRPPSACRRWINP